MRHVTKELAPLVRNELSRLEITIGGISQRSGDWVMNEARYKQYQKDLVAELNEQLGERIALSSWTQKTDEQKRRLLKEKIARAKEAVRNRIKKAAG